MDQREPQTEAVEPLPPGRTKLQWILEAGWKGLCPRCGKGRMFRSWLKIVDRCEVCGLDYRFAAPDDGPAFFVLCFVLLPMVLLVVWMQVHFEPPWWIHLFTSLPLIVAGSLYPLRPIKGWLVASQYLNRAQEAGTEGLWHKMNERDDGQPN